MVPTSANQKVHQFFSGAEATVSTPCIGFDAACIHRARVADVPSPTVQLTGSNAAVRRCNSSPFARTRARTLPYEAWKFHQNQQEEKILARRVGRLCCVQVTARACLCESLAAGVPKAPRTCTILSACRSRLLVHVFRYRSFHLFTLFFLFLMLSKDMADCIKAPREYRHLRARFKFYETCATQKNEKWKSYTQPRNRWNLSGLRRVPTARTKSFCGSFRSASGIG